MSCRRHSAPAAGKSGTLISTPLDGGPAVVCDTVQCIHCQYTSRWVPGSEKWWGYCERCAGLTCGQAFCRAMGCVHKEARLDNIEAGRPEDFKRIIASVPPGRPCGIILG